MNVLQKESDNVQLTEMTYVHKTENIEEVNLFDDNKEIVQYLKIKTKSSQIYLKSDFVFSGLIVYNKNFEDWQKIEFFDVRLDSNFVLKDEDMSLEEKDVKLFVICKLPPEYRSRRILEKTKFTLFFSQYTINDEFQPETSNDKYYLIYTIGVPIVCVVIIIILVVWLVRLKKKKQRQNKENKVPDRQNNPLGKSEEQPLNVQAPPLSLKPVTVLNEKGEQQVIYIASPEQTNQINLNNKPDNQLVTTNQQIPGDLLSNMNVQSNQTQNKLSVLPGFSAMNVSPSQLLSQANPKTNSDGYSQAYYPEPIYEAQEENNPNYSPFGNNFNMNPHEAVPDGDEVPIYEVDTTGLKDYTPNMKFGG
jgi:hypothetical protein